MGNQANDNLTDYDGYSVDLNCDVGESTGSQIIGNDPVLIPLVSSANIACGGHGGDQEHVARAVQIAIEHGVTIVPTLAILIARILVDKRWSYLPSS